MRFMRRDVILGAMGAFMAVVLLGAGTLVLRNDGIQYPDGSIQRTADAVVVDSIGEVVGPVIGFSSRFNTGGNLAIPTVEPVILFRGDTHPLVFNFGGGLYVPRKLVCTEGCISHVREVYYSLPDCEGSAFTPTGGNGFDEFVDVKYALGYQEMLYRTSSLTWLTNEPYQSRGHSIHCTNQSSDLSSAWALEYTGLDLDVLFTPPYHIE